MYTVQIGLTRESLFKILARSETGFLDSCEILDQFAANPRLSSLLTPCQFAANPRQFAANPRQFAANPRQFAANPRQFSANPTRQFAANPRSVRC